MRILQAHNIQLGYGGADLVLEREKVMLESHGHAVHRFSVDNRSLESMSRLQAGVKAVWNRQAADQLQKDIVQFKPDVVHIHTPFPIMSPLVFRRAKQLGFPVVQTCHGYRNFCANGLLLRNRTVCNKCNGRKIKWPAVAHRCYKNSLPASIPIAASLTLHSLLGTFSRHVDTFIVLTEFARQKLIKEGIPADKIAVKQNFLSGVTSAGPGDGGYALYIGRLEPEKGIKTMLEAWSSHDMPVPLRIAGDGSMRDYVNDVASKNTNIEYMEFMNQKDIAEQLSSAAFLVIPSEWYEAGFTLVMIEALAAGCPILSSDIGNFSDYVIPQQTGQLFRCGDSEDLATQVESLVHKTDQLKTMRQICRRQFEDLYSAEVNYPILMQIYEKAINRSRGQSRSG